MAKKKQTAGPQSKNKSPSALEDVMYGLEALHERVAQVEDLKSEGFPYRDALRARAELQIRETIRNVFGERSQEYQQLKQFSIQSTDEGDIAHALRILQALILIMENRRLEIIGIEPGIPSSPSHTTANRAIDAYQKSSPLSAAQSRSSVPSRSRSKQHSHSSAGSSPSSTGPLKIDSPVTSSPDAIEINLPRTTSLPPPAAEPSIHSFSSRDSAFARILVIANRFHAVARRLRLRRDYRSTLEVEDQYDVQDLFGSLLKIDFEEVGSEEWMPDYGGFSSQSTFFIGQGQLAIVLKKTRPGWGSRELIAELAIDINRYATYPECNALFCFVYDPEGRIGNPTSLEERVAKQDYDLSVRLLISPK